MVLIESDKDDNDFECHNGFDGKSVQVNSDKERTEGGPAPAILPKNRKKK